LGIVVILFGLAISDLIVGVSNDAVNFLNSAIGSKAAPRWFILIIASIGIILGVTFSSGMMEVARKGIFHPQNFFMPELLVIFLAVMLTDIILLDLYNTFALPTSTTVSVVFELLGSSVAVSLIKIHQMGQNTSELINYINTAKALAIISGILLSIIIAFSIGMFVQFITRLIFTFDFKSRLKRYGALWGGVALTAITYFILIKGAKGASFITAETLTWIQTHTAIILLLNFLFWALVLQIFLLFSKIDILKLIVLIGTGALAMAFAANDLVNFIGVPLAGFTAFRLASQSGGDISQADMSPLSDTVQTNTWILLVAGVIMVVTLWLSKKARSVTRTEVSLGRQNDEGYERFGSSFLARTIVGMFISFFDGISKIVPTAIKQKIARRFDTSVVYRTDADAPSFDLLRASVNLMVASTIISFATSLKLPLSTTYVTFMVAMGSSLSDRAWGRESAVYRVTGVLTVVAGWFFTAAMAFLVSMVFATLIYFFRVPAILGLVLLAVFLLVRSHRVHKSREEKIEKKEIQAVYKDSFAARDKIIKNLESYIGDIGKNLQDVLQGIIDYKRKLLKKSKQNASTIETDALDLTSDMLKLLQLTDDKSAFEPSPMLIGSIRELSRQLLAISKLTFDYVDNHHRELLEVQKIELLQLKSQIQDSVNACIEAMHKIEKHEKIDQVEMIEKLRDDALSFYKKQVKRMKKGRLKTKQSVLYLEILSHIEEIANQLIELITGYRETFS